MLAAGAERSSSRQALANGIDELGLLATKSGNLTSIVATILATGSRGSGYRRTVGSKPRPDATPAERRLWGTGMVPGSVARNKGRKVSAERVAAQRDKARRKREDDWPTGKAKPARLGESIEPAGMTAWVRDD